MNIEYICKEISPFNMPEYKGEQYEALVPDTLDLQERLSLSVNGLTGPTDPNADYELYWKVRFRWNPPMMQHDWSDCVQAKFFEDLPLVRLASGSALNLHVEHKWMEIMLHMQGPDGLLYFPKKGRPWWKILVEKYCGPEPPGDHYTMPFCNGRYLNAMTIYYLLTGDETWRKAGERLIQGVTELAEDSNGGAIFRKAAYGPKGGVNPKDGGPLENMLVHSGWPIQGLANFYRVTGYEPARALAEKLGRYITEYANYFGPDGCFMPEGTKRDIYGRDTHTWVHFHSHTLVLLGLLELAIVSGNKELQKFVRRGYEYGRSKGVPLVGFFPELLGRDRFETSETCQVADMLALAVKMSAAGIADYWDDADRWVRNMFAEAQLTHIDWVSRMVQDLPPSSIDESYQTGDHVPERNLGAFAGWPSANDWQGRSEHSIMHCCTGNGARALYYIWENILHYTDGKLRVNLLLNHFSRWADVYSHIPYLGQVDVKIKFPLELSIRIPEWVKPEETVCTVNSIRHLFRWDGRYAQVGEVKPGDAVTLTFPIIERIEKIYIEKQPYTLIIKGNDVVFIDPPGRYCPLYQRAHYRQNTTRWRKITRFIPDKIVNW